MALAHEADGVVQHSAYLCGVVSVDDEHERGLHELIRALVGAFLKSQETAASCNLGILNDIIYVLFRVELLRHEHQLEALAQTREVAQRIGSDKAAYRAADGDCKRRRVDEPVHLTALEDTENDHAESADTSLPAYNADPLTGEPRRSNGRMVGVMVNNISNTQRQNARPQRGIGSADLLIESKVEGGISRFCAVYHDANAIPEVGPLRSGRDQFLQLLMPHQALYYHDGESIFCTQFINVYDYSGLNIGGKSYFNTPVHPHVAHRDSRGRNVAYEHTEFTSGKEIKQAAGNAGIGLTYANETPFFHFADYRTAASNDLPGAPAAKTISITHSESYRTRLTYNSWGRSYKLEMYNRSKKAYENTVDELTGKQLTFDNVVVCFADIAAYAGDSHDVQSVNYVAGGQAYLFTRGGVQVGRWEKTYPTNPLKLYTKSGEEMTLNRGKTYFALVDNDELSNFSYQ